MSLHALHLASLTALLRTPSAQWSLLVLSAHTTSLLAPTLTIPTLKKAGITLTLQIQQPRDIANEIDAIYIVEPNAVNIKYIIDDLTRGLYQQYYLFFIEPIGRQLLEELAQGAEASGRGDAIMKVADQYSNFLPLDSYMFTLNHPNSFLTLQNPQSTESIIAAEIEHYVNALVSVIVTLGSPPHIRYSRNTSAEMVAARLDARLRDIVSNPRSNLFPAEGSMKPRPVLILTDRTADLCSVLAHTWTYESLVYDALNMNNNRVSFELEDGKRKVYDIDVNDFMWSQNCNKPFPELAENVDAQLTKYKSDTEDLLKANDVSSIDQISGDMTAANLKAAVSQLPQLTERKKVIDQHMNMASALLRTIQRRHIDQLIAMEEDISRKSREDVIKLLSADMYEREDRLRTFGMWYLSTSADLSEFQAYFNPAEWGGLKYLERLRQYSQLNTQSQQSTLPNPKSVFAAGLSRWTDQLAGTGSFSGMVSGLKNLLPTQRDLPLTKLVEGIMDGVSEVDMGCYDPKSKRGPSSSGGKFTEAIVFVCGGGTAQEALDLQVMASRGPSKKSITYGSCEILNAKRLLDQLIKLAS